MKGQSAGDRRQGGCEWKTRQQEVTEVRLQRVQLSDVHISSHCRDRDRCHGSRKQVHEWFGECGRFCSRPNWQSCRAKVDTAVSSATEPSVCRLVQLTQSKGEVSEEAKGNGKRVTYGPTPREAEEEGHLPGYVSVTSKKEERRDTWSESNKSVPANIIIRTSSTTGAAHVRGWGREWRGVILDEWSPMQEKQWGLPHVLLNIPRVIFSKIYVYHFW